MKKTEFRKRLDEYMEQILDYFQNDLSHDNGKVVITIDRHKEIIRINNRVIDDGMPFSVQAPLLLQNPQHDKVKPKSFQDVLDKINDLITV